MIIVGIVGGVASGKSAVAAKLADWGAVVIDGDKLGHLVLERPDVVQAARSRWGEGVLDGPQIDRRAVAARVFRQDALGRADLEFWEGVTFPLIGRSIEDELDKLPEQTIVALDAAVMFKAGWDRRCDHILFVEAPIEQRRRRAMERRGWTAAQFAWRESAQLDVEEKRRRSSFVIDNSRSLAQTYEQVEGFWNSLSL